MQVGHSRELLDMSNDTCNIMSKPTLPKLPVKFKTEWVNALRSGKYKQAQRTLNDQTNDSYCCLGVAGKVCGLSDSQLHGYYLDGNLTTVAPKHKTGLKVLVETDELQTKFAHFNDDAKRSFDWIASYIERYM